MKPHCNCNSGPCGAPIRVRVRVRVRVRSILVRVRTVTVAPVGHQISKTGGTASAGSLIGEGTLKGAEREGAKERTGIQSSGEGLVGTFASHRDAIDHVTRLLGCRRSQCYENRERLQPG